MPRFDVKNPNGSLVFVGKVRVKPYANFSANLDSFTARELSKFGVSVKPVIVEEAPSSKKKESKPKPALVTLPEEPVVEKTETKVKEEEPAPVVEAVEPAKSASVEEADTAEEAVDSATVEEASTGDSSEEEEPEEDASTKDSDEEVSAEAPKRRKKRRSRE